ncbi:MAG: pole-organizing protein PopZ [Phenylobacterium zucineum]|nr:MAG: pole-organizing protein PopZ [Phenylobacterium zucineum]
MPDAESQEPTMEEILASIRRIISEDEAPAAEPPPPVDIEPPPAPLVKPAPAPVLDIEPPPPPPKAEPEPVIEEDVLELTEKIETVGDLEVYTPASPPPPVEYDPGPGLVSTPAASAAAAAFGHLSSTLLMPRDGRTLEDVTRELLRPLLKQWLDDHLPRIVQETVQAEVDRISRGGRG